MLTGEETTVGQVTTGLLFIFLGVLIILRPYHPATEYELASDSPPSEWRLRLERYFLRSFGILAIVIGLVTLLSAV